MKTINKQLCFGLVIFTLAIHANAALEKGWYLGANLGSTEVDIGVTNLTGNARLDESDFGGKVLMGREINSFFALEGFAASLGIARVEGSPGDSFQYQGYTVVLGSVGDAEFSSTSLGMTAKLMLPLGDSFKLYGKAGIQFWSTTNNITNLDNDVGTGTYLGGGMSLDITDTISFTLDYDRYELENTAEMISAGLQYNF